MSKVTISISQDSNQVWLIKPYQVDMVLLSTNQSPQETVRLDVHTLLL